MADSSLTGEILRNLIQDQKLPPENFSLKSLTYKTLNFIFDLFEENNTPNKYILTVLSHILKKTEDEICKIVKQPVNFINKAKRYIKKNQNNLEVKHPDLSSYNLPKQINFIGNSCQEIGITLDTLQQLLPPTTTNDSVSVNFSLNNGSILELDQVRLKQKLTYQQFLDIVSHLSCENLEAENFDLEQFKYELKKIKNSNEGFLRIEKKQKRPTKICQFSKIPLLSAQRLRKMWKIHHLTLVLFLRNLSRKKKIFWHISLKHLLQKFHLYRVMCL